MYIITADGILADALGVMLEEIGFTDVKKRQSMPSVNDLIIVDCDTVDIGDEEVIRISSDKSRGADLVRPFTEEEFKSFFAPYVNQSVIQREDDAPDTVKSCAGGVICCGKFVRLSPTEQRIAALLVGNKGRCVPISDIMNASGGDLNSARVYIRQLRRKLDFAFGRRIIYTVRGKGYMIKRSAR